MTTTPTTTRRRARDATDTPKPAAAKAPAKKITPKATAPVVEAPPARKPASKTDPANITATNVAGFPVAPWIPEHLRERVGNPVKGHKGYYVRVPFVSFAFAARVDDIAGPNWLVVCEHGTTHGAPAITGEDGCEKTAARRAEWCEKCAAAKAERGTGAGSQAAAIAKRTAHDMVAELIADTLKARVKGRWTAIEEDEKLAEAISQIAAYHTRLAGKTEK
jgi:hypothetical protein